MRARSGFGLSILIGIGVLATTVSAEQILFDQPLVEVLPGDEVSLLILLAENVTPLLGYSLDVGIVPAGGATGSVVADVAATNFFDSQNLITAGGAMRDPFFSTILDAGDGGVFISTNTDDGSTVLAVPGANDVLAQVVFDVSEDALGDFSIDLGPASALSDGAGFAVPFDFLGGTIHVVPEPAALTLLLSGLLTVRLSKARRGAGG
jgi:hypothetical protein